MLARIVATVVMPPSSRAELPPTATIALQGQAATLLGSVGSQAALLPLRLTAVAAESSQAPLTTARPLDPSATGARPSPLAPSGDPRVLRAPEPRAAESAHPSAVSSPEHPPAPPVIITSEPRLTAAVPQEAPKQLAASLEAGHSTAVSSRPSEAAIIGAQSFATSTRSNPTWPAVGSLDDDKTRSSSWRPAPTPLQQLVDPSALHPGQAALILAQHNVRFVLPMFSARQLRRGGVAGTESGTEHEISAVASTDLFGAEVLTIGEEPPLEGSFGDAHSRHWFDLFSRHQRRARQGLSRVTRRG